MKIVNKTSVGQRRVYDIEVEDVHNFYANGINVHNCATDGGVSVIKDDGTVVDSASTVSFGAVSFSSDGNLAFQRASQGRIYVEKPPFTDSFLADGDRNYASAGTTPALISDSQTYDLSFGDTETFYSGFIDGLVRLNENRSDATKGMVAYTTSTYNTGWMPGDIKLAGLSDTDDTDLVAAGLGYDDFTTYADQAAAEAAGYTFTSCTFDAANDQVDFSGVSATLNIPTGLSAGSPAIVQITTSNYVSGGASVQSSFAGLSAFEGPSNLNANGTSRFYIPSIGSLRISTTALNASIDSISVRLADEDRSVNSAGLIVKGTVTRTPVATGADLVAYSGFSASNYLEQPYNSDLDFGTGDFCVMGWGNPVNTSTAPFLGRGVSDRLLEVMMTSNSARIYCNNTLVINHPVTAANRFFHVAAVRASGVLYLYLDGVLAASAASTQNVTEVNATLRLGRDHGGSSLTAGKIALWRISATAPTAEQIAKIYNDEKVLFQEGAQATLYGASDAVTALAYDEDTDLLHVGTSAGRSIFNGLRRINNTTTGVTTAISATNGVIAEQ